MKSYILTRFAQSALVLFIMSLLVFGGVNLVGDPVEMLINPEADQAEVERVMRELGLDRPVTEQYWYFVVNAFKGDLGDSFIFGEPALKLILQRMPATLELACFSLFISLLVAIPLGIYAGYKPDSKVSKTIMAGSILGFSMPTFWVGIIFIMIFAVQLGWLPSTGRGEIGVFLGIHSSLFTLDGLSHVFLPALHLALFKISGAHVIVPGSSPPNTTNIKLSLSPTFSNALNIFVGIEIISPASNIVSCLPSAPQ